MFQTHPGSPPLKPAYELEIVPHAEIAGTSVAWRLVYHHGPKGHLFLRRGDPETQEVSALRFSGSSLRIQQAPLRLLTSP